MCIFPTSYFPPIAYFARYIIANTPYIEAHEHFVKQSIRTRCELLGPNGKQVLSIPIYRHMGNKTTMNNIQIINNGWEKIHWKTIKTAYSSAPFFEHYGVEVWEMLNIKKNSLLSFNDFIFQRILSWLGYEKQTIFTNTYTTTAIIDYRNTPFDTQSQWQHTPYTQVFRQKDNCMSNLSILDLIFNEGPLARNFIDKNRVTQP